MVSMIETDPRCESCKKDWTKCRTCSVMMQWVREMREKNVVVIITKEALIGVQISSNRKLTHLKEESDMLCTQKCCLKNHNVGIIECDEEHCSNRTKF